MYTDSHCHLNFPELLGQIGDIRAAMAQASVTRALCIATTLEAFPQVHGLATDYANFWATVGVHPDSEDVAEPTFDDLVQRAALPRVVAIGETGLDYYRLNGRSVADMEWQRERFRVHIRAAQATAKPLVIHTRSASDDTLAILREEGDREVRWFHAAQRHVPTARPGPLTSNRTPSGGPALTRVHGARCLPYDVRVDFRITISEYRVEAAD